jgi:asparagine synthase (glutamine-hydrolysing)
MCGIAGIYAYHYAANSIDRNELKRVRDHMASRGPDGSGIWLSPDERIGLGHRRLSIIDLTERGAQPMANSSGNLIITFNGEIYNYRELRAFLEKQGHVFFSDTDTEVLLHLYAEKGEGMVHDLRGMFAFAIWDSERNALFLARDPYGIKPLYYADDGWTLRFASQVKALLAGGKVSRDPEPAGQVGFFLFGSVPEPFTTCQEIRALPAGSTLWVDRLGPRGTKRYFSIAEAYRDSERSCGHVSEEGKLSIIHDALLDSVRHHLVADVPVGAFLSSGVDSAALVALMCEAGQKDVQTVTLAFDEFRGKHADESPIAAEVAKYFGTRHTTRFISEREFTEDLPKIFEAMDQPTIDGINTWFVSKAARELGLKVAISGLGGDELFGGYPSFSDVPFWARVLAIPGRIPGLGVASRKLLAGMSRRSKMLSPKAISLVEYGKSFPGAYFLRRGLFMPWELEALADKDTVRLGLQRLKPIGSIEALLEPMPRSGFGKVAVLESSAYMRNQLLRDTDWASMAHSLEVRVPLVDSILLRRLAPIVSKEDRSNSKRLLVNGLGKRLPESVTRRSKTGFTTPLHTWIQRDNRLQGWRAVSSLASTHCHWARRWAFEIAQGAGSSIGSGKRACAFSL